jgi:hypothetical protein
MIGVDGGFTRRTKRNLIGRGVIHDVEEGEGPVTGQRTADMA